MKKTIVFICTIAVVLTISSCNKCYVYYARCETCHPTWQGSGYRSCHGDMADTQRKKAQMDAEEHDLKMHGGVTIAKVISVYE
jgi:hypothetical protein